MAEEFTTPPPLEAGDEVAVVAPSGGAASSAPDTRDLGLDRLRDRLDLNPVLYPAAEADDEYLREHPEARAQDGEGAFRIRMSGASSRQPAVTTRSEFSAT